MPIEIPINYKLTGMIKSIKLRDMRNGKVVEERKNIKNMHLDAYLNKFFTMTHISMLSVVEVGSYNYGTPLYCAIGSDNTPPDRSQTGVLDMLASAKYSSKDSASLGEDPLWTEWTYIFPAGTGTGTIREIAIGYYDNNSDMIARQVIEPEIVKGDNHQLEVTWRREVARPTGMTGTITGGQRDGTTDINWKITINNTQFYRQLSGRYIHSISSYNKIYNPWAYLFGMWDNPVVITGDSNASSDVINDTEYTIKGNQLFNDEITPEAESYISGSYQRKSRIGFEIDQSNGQIGELIIGSYSSASTSYARTGLFRMTFDPPLDKVDNFRLYLDITIGIQAS